MGCDPEVCVPLADGSTFRLSAYVRSREAITEEFSRRMPGMQQFVADWLRAHEPDKWHKRALTAKSYLLQEAEGISRRAKLAWAARRGDVRVANLQHDGIVVALPTTVQAEGVAACMTARPAVRCWGTSSRSVRSHWRLPRRQRRRVCAAATLLRWSLSRRWPW